MKQMHGENIDVVFNFFLFGCFCCNTNLVHVSLCPGFFVQTVSSELLNNRYVVGLASQKKVVFMPYVVGLASQKR